MKNIDIKKCYISKKEVPHPLTEKLIAGDYKQKSGGYIKYSKEQGVVEPSQYWHLIESWCNRRVDDALFNRRIQCGELLVWMAEVVAKEDELEKLGELVELILADYRNNRRQGNRNIQEICFPIIEREVKRML